MALPSRLPLPENTTRLPAIVPAGQGILSAKEGQAMRRHLDRLIQALVLVRLGQQLGTDSDLAQAVAHGIDLVVSTLSRFLA
jgi:hypothetical protein